MAASGWIEDRWLTKRKNPKTGKRERTQLWGKCKRYRVAGIPGVRKRSFDTLEEAKNWRATTIAATKKKEFVDDRDGEILLGDYIEEEWWPSREYDTNTAGPMRSKVFNHIVDTALGRTPMYVIDDDHLAAWKKELKGRGLADSTVEVIWNHLSSIFKSAIHKKRIATNPCREADSNVRPAVAADTKARAWTAAEAHAIRSNVRRRYQIVPDLGMHAGQRQGEAFGFSPDDVDRERKMIHVRRQLLWENGTKPYFKLPKGKKERTVPLSDGLLQLIDAHTEEFPAVTVTLPWKGPGNSNRETAKVRLLATTQFGNPIHPSTYNGHTMKPALAAAGLIAARTGGERWGWEQSREMMHHRWRHTYASVQLAAGEDPVAVSLWLGHASPAITFNVYAHFIPDRGDRGRTAMDAWLARAAAAKPVPADLEGVAPLGWREVLPLAMPAPAPAELFVQGARYAGAWGVGVLLERDGSLVGEIRTDPGEDPARALAAALAWVRECCALEDLAVAAAENLSGEFPEAARPYQALARLQLAPSRAAPSKPPQNSLSH